MTNEEYCSALQAIDDELLCHGAKWKDHKYIRIENGRYIYPEDLNKGRNKNITGAGKEIKKRGIAETNSPVGDNAKNLSRGILSMIPVSVLNIGSNSELISNPLLNDEDDLSPYTPSFDERRNDYKNAGTSLGKLIVSMYEGKDSEKLKDECKKALEKMDFDFGTFNNWVNHSYKDISEEERAEKIKYEGETAILLMSDMAYEYFASAQFSLKDKSEENRRKLNDIFDEVLQSIKKNSATPNSEWGSFYTRALHRREAASVRNDDTNNINKSEQEGKAMDEWKRNKVKHSLLEDSYHAALQAIDDETVALTHHGILGMKWGIRRYQNPDGSLTALGRKHYEDGSGRTERAIEKWNQRKGSALAKGDVKFAKKNMDYLSNQELAAFKERISARTSLDDLKQASRKITADKLNTWANMANSASNLISGGINAYNSAAKIINSVSGKQVVPVMKDVEKEQDPDKWITRVVKYKDSSGRDVTETYGKKGGGK